MTKLLFVLAALSAGAAAAAPTFNQDVAPIVYQHCAQCHRPGEVAPFSLLSYDDAKRRAKQIAAVTQVRYMPPWKPEAGHGEFENERRLTSDQISTLAAWAKAGAPEGDKSRQPTPPQFPSDWQAGKPDLIFQMDRQHSIAAGGRNDFRCFVISVDLPEDRWISTVEFRPSNPKVAHHAVLFVDYTGGARQLAARAEGGNGYECFGGPGVPAGVLGIWTPGDMPRPWAQGHAKRLGKKADLVLQMHYNPTGKPEQDQTAIGVKFTTRPSRITMLDVLGSRAIDIPAGEKNYTVKDSYVLPTETKLVDIQPHQHYLGRTAKVDAFLPDGTVKPLIWIKDWDFNWQGSYQYKEPVTLPKGTRLEAVMTFDNSDSNPRNPFKPARRVTFGEESQNEMGLIIMNVSVEPKDLNTYRTVTFLDRVERWVAEGGDPSGQDTLTFPRLKEVFQQADEDRDGKLNETEKQNFAKLYFRRP